MSEEARYTLASYDYVARFNCLGDQCEDTCCKGWGMQLDDTRFALYQSKAPELLSAVTSGEAAHIMRRDPATDYCVKFEGGLCGIHKKYGTDFLGDACHFYPRITRKFGDTYLQSASLSCPEIVRLALYGDTPFVPSSVVTDRTPTQMKEYLPEGITADQAIELQHLFVNAVADESVSPEHALMRLHTVGQSLSTLPQKEWPSAAPFFLRMADGRLLEPEHDSADGYRLVQILEGLVGAAKPSSRPRLDETRKEMQNTLGIRIAANTFDILSESGDFGTYSRLCALWKKSAANQMAPILRRWLQAQLTMMGFPFSGFGTTLNERTMLLAGRFATLRLALMSAMDKQGTPPDAATTVRIVQSLSRFIDHLAEPAFTLLAYEEAGWNDPARLRGLVMDAAE